MSIKKNVYLRADGNSIIGLGHLSRIIAISNQLAGKVQLFFFTRKSTIISSEINNIFKKIYIIPDSIDIYDEPEFIQKTINSDGDIIVFDGYSFNKEYFDLFNNSNKKLIYIDDFNNNYFNVDVIINPSKVYDQNIFLNKKIYSGHNYAFLKKEFLLENNNSNGPNSNASNILIFMGGADISNYNKIFLDYLLEYNKINLFNKIIIITSSYNNNLSDLKEIKNKNILIEILTDLSADQMINVLKSCRIAITSASVISYEVCAIGVPLICVQSADNQKYMYEILINNNVAIGLGKIENISNLLIFEAINQILEIETLKKLVSNQKKFLDGKSMERIEKAILT